MVGTYADVGIVVEDLWRQNRRSFLAGVHVISHELSIFLAVRVSDVDLLVVDLFRLECPQDVVLFLLHLKPTSSPRGTLDSQATITAVD